MKDNQIKQAEENDKDFQDWAKHKFNGFGKFDYNNAYGNTEYAMCRYVWGEARAKLTTSQVSEPVAYNHHFMYANGDLEEVLSHKPTVPSIQGMEYTGKTDILIIKPNLMKWIAGTQRGWHSQEFQCSSCKHWICHEINDDLPSTCEECGAKNE
jgi:hypothetical protein